jgi:hypothetical protein
VKWCRENAALCGLADAPIRYIADDCLKFVRREVKRGRRYDAVIMDPPTFGRGSTGEMWRLEDHLWELLSECRALLSDDPLFFLINAYTARLSPTVVANLLGQLLHGLPGERSRPARWACRSSATARCSLRDLRALGERPPAGLTLSHALARRHLLRTRGRPPCPRPGGQRPRDRAARAAHRPVDRRGGVVHTFGSGHSELISREIIGRAGGLVCVTGIIDPTGDSSRTSPATARLVGALRPPVPARPRGDRHRRLQLGQERLADRRRPLRQGEGAHRRGPHLPRHVEGHALPASLGQAALRGRRPRARQRRRAGRRDRRRRRDGIQRRARPRP